MMRTILSAAWVAGALCSFSACALLTKQSLPVPRYFTPEGELAEPGTKASPVANARLRLGRVSAASNLRERIAYRTSDHEIRYYENRRWTDRPDAYLHRALARSLFERHGLTRVMSGTAPILQVELTAFEEITQVPHRVRVEVTMLLYDQESSGLQQTLRVEENVAAADPEQTPEAVVEALSEALLRVVEQVAQRSAERILAAPEQKSIAAE